VSLSSPSPSWFAKLSLIISLHVHRLWISLLTEFGSKTSKRNTTKNKYMGYLKFVLTLLTCHDLLKNWVALVWRKINFAVNPSELRAINVTTAFTILKFLEYPFLKGFVAQGRQQSFWNFPSFQISWTWRDVFQRNEKFFQQLFAIFIWREGKGGKFSNQV